MSNENTNFELSHEEIKEIYLASQGDIMNGITYPEQKISSSKDYIPWGKDNKYPDKLVQLYNASAIHNSIIYNKKTQVSGKGISFDTEGKAAKKTAKFLENFNTNGEDVNEILSKISLDFELFGSYALLLTYSKDWKQILSVEHMEMSKVRCAKPIDNKGTIHGYFYSYDWSSYRPKKVYIPKFDPENTKEKIKEREALLEKFTNTNKLTAEEIAELKDKNRTQLLVYKPYSPDTYFYSNPSYIGAIQTIETDIEADIYAYSALKNGFDPSYHITIPNLPDKAAQIAYVKAFMKKVKGSRNAKMPLVSFVKDINDKPIIDKLDSSDLNKTYVAINENTLQKMITGHRLTHPLLGGIQVAGKLGNSIELETAFNIWYSTVIQPDQFDLLKGPNKIMKYNNMETLSIEKLNPFEVEKDIEEVDGQEDGNNNEVIDSEEVTDSNESTSTEKNNDSE
ncbi:hypothetical protein EV201_1263 [Ancylomarina subtilis]|uniref:SPP1 family phage portal protein n=1 Tax=Ancylomarina subtilis TaxID=1639035 RepID=A0A4Q7VKA1_9BACT|nr:hypothetical protein [Ancylomarina subtilis]RZT96622.1 hypothetical protein EV201_1263 [Ancylomarina subtilis]